MGDSPWVAKLIQDHSGGGALKGLLRVRKVTKGDMTRAIAGSSMRCFGWFARARHGAIRRASLAIAAPSSAFADGQRTAFGSLELNRLELKRLELDSLTTVS
jgi:hypothetical protein